MTPLAVMTKPAGCPGKCVYCPTYADAPQSYTPESPAVFRARACGFEPIAQVELRLRTFREMGHPTDKIELIVMGGTFLAQPVDYQYRFIKECYDGLNGTASGSLEEAKKINETAANRCTGLCIETRPDWCGEAEIKRMLEFGATRVELGVQAPDEEIYKLVKRGHGVKEVVEATARLRENGFKVYYHIMPGLPGATPEKDVAMAKLIFDDERFKPDGLKIYPTMVVEGSELYRWYQDGRYQPYDNETMERVIIGIKSIVPKYVRIARVLRDIPSKFIVAGLKDSLRDRVAEKMRAESIACRCIRCREYGHRARQRFKIGEAKLTRLDYQAAGGLEIYLAYEDENETLFGLLRLRIQSKAPHAIIRELHVYGPEVPLSAQDDKAAQHRGYGKGLLNEAERIAREEFEADEIFVLSGTGAKEYYKGLGYRDKGAWMRKEWR